MPSHDRAQLLKQHFSVRRLIDNAIARAARANDEGVMAQIHLEIRTLVQERDAIEVELGDDRTGLT